MSGAEAVSTLAARIRREGDLSSRIGQMGRLYDLADEADTLRAQLEAAEGECARLRDCLEYALAQHNGYLPALANHWSAKAMNVIAEIDAARTKEQQA